MRKALGSREAGASASASSERTFGVIAGGGGCHAASEAQVRTGRRALLVWVELHVAGITSHGRPRRIGLRLWHCRW